MENSIFIVFPTFIDIFYLPDLPCPVIVFYLIYNISLWTSRLLVGRCEINFTFPKILSLKGMKYVDVLFYWNILQNEASNILTLCFLYCFLANLFLYCKLQSVTCKSKKTIGEESKLNILVQ